MAKTKDGYSYTDLTRRNSKSMFGRGIIPTLPDRDQKIIYKLAEQKGLEGWGGLYITYLWHRQKGKCAGCNGPMILGPYAEHEDLRPYYITLDHIVPMSWPEGLDLPSNHQGMHDICNIMKADKPFEDFLAKDTSDIKDKAVTAFTDVSGRSRPLKVGQQALLGFAALAISVQILPEDLHVNSGFQSQEADRYELTL